MFRNTAFLVTLAALAFLPAAADFNALFLSTSEAFPHGPIVRQDGDPAVAEEVLSRVVAAMGGSMTATKDASLINANNLAHYDAVIFYTQGDLTKPNVEGAPTMEPQGVPALLEWIEQGGAFLGFHSATDTFTTGDDTVSPYIAMTGAQFAGHGAQFVGELAVVDPGHPVAPNIPDGWRLMDEWYLFSKWNEDMRVIALLEPGAERTRQEMYNVPAYPVIWCRAPGEGRVYYNAMGHREDVWTNPVFQRSVRDALQWALGEGEPHAAPNFKAVVPTEIPSTPRVEQPAAGAEQGSGE